MGKQRMPKTSASNTSTNRRTTSNLEFAVITYMFLLLFILMMGYFVYFQFIKSEDVINSPYNKRQDTFAEHVVRGEIKAAGGEVLARTVQNEDGTETRSYPYGSMFAHAVGYDSNGKSGIESFANFNLLRSNTFFLEKIVNGIRDEKNLGDNVVTTLDYRLQEIAFQALGNQNGAILVIEPATGKILTMVSKPDFDPNSVVTEWENIISNEDEENSVLLNRTTQGLYPPGSTFKFITLLEYIRENPDYKDYHYHCEGVFSYHNTQIHCYQNAAHGDEDLKTAFAKSCNSAFSSIGLTLNKSKLADLCDDLLFHHDLPTAFPFQQSKFHLDQNSDSADVMQTAIGQGETLVTPMHMALLTSAIANQGVLMTPYIIDHTENAKGIAVKEYKSKEYGIILPEQEIKVLDEYMKNVVENGTASKLKDGNYTAAGKTGSAEFNDIKGESHAWFMGYAHNESLGGLAVTVIVERGGAGSEAAVPIAKQLFDQYFNR